MNEFSTEIGIVKAYRGSIHTLPVIVSYATRKSHTVHPQQEDVSALLPWKVEGRFPSSRATSPDNKKCHSAANKKLLSPCAINFLQ